MELTDLKKARMNLIKESLLNINNIVFIVLLVIVIYLSINNKNVIFAFVLLGIVFVLELIAFILEYLTLKDIYQYKNKNKEFKYKNMDVDKNKLIKSIEERGIPSTYLEINKKIYFIELSVYKNKYNGCIDYENIKDVEKIKSLISKSTSKNIKIYMINGEKPGKYLHKFVL